MTTKTRPVHELRPFKGTGFGTLWCLASVRQGMRVANSALPVTCPKCIKAKQLGTKP